MLAEAELQKVKAYVLRKLPDVLRQDTEFALYLEGMLAEKFPRRDEFALLLSRSENLQKELSEFRNETNQRFEQVDKRFEQVDKRFEQVDKHFEQVDKRFEQINKHLRRLDTDVGGLKGSDFEARVRRSPQPYLGKDVVRGRVLTEDRLFNLLDKAIDQGRIQDDEADDIRLADGIVQARERNSGQDIWFAVEVSVVVDAHDIERAERRAAYLQRAVAPAPARALVIGERITEGAQRFAKAEQTRLVFTQDVAELT